ncbi:MAG: hypothetical protein ACI8ZB_005529 [Desulforhopalus sp.]|jgi:hypothetical protein
MNESSPYSTPEAELEKIKEPLSDIDILNILSKEGYEVENNKDDEVVIKLPHFSKAIVFQNKSTDDILIKFGKLKREIALPLEVIVSLIMIYLQWEHKFLVYGFVAVIMYNFYRFKISSNHLNIIKEIIDKA